MFIWNGPGILKGTGVKYKPGDEVPEDVVPDEMLEAMKADGRISDPDAKPRPAAKPTKSKTSAAVQKTTKAGPKPPKSKKKKKADNG